MFVLLLRKGYKIERFINELSIRIAMPQRDLVDLVNDVVRTMNRRFSTQDNINLITPEQAQIEKEAIGILLNRINTSQRKFSSLAVDYRLKYGIDAYRMLMGVFGNYRYVTRPNGANVEFHLDVGDPKVLNSMMGGIKATFQLHKAFRDLTQLMLIGRARIYEVPTIFFHTRNHVDTSRLDGLLDAKNYRPLEANIAESSGQKYVSRRAEMPSRDGVHNIVVKYELSKKNNKFYVTIKYMDFGAKNSKGGSDKMDIVVRIGSNGLPYQLLHTEIFSPDDMEKPYESTENWDKASALDQARQIALELGISGKETKTIMKTGEQKHWIFTENGKVPDQGTGSLSSYYLNFDQIARNPLALGGWTFKHTVDHAIHNFSRLEDIYNEKIRK